MVPTSDGYQVIEDGLALYSSSHFNSPLVEDVDLRETSKARLSNRVSIGESTPVANETVIVPAQM